MKVPESNHVNASNASNVSAPRNAGAAAPAGASVRVPSGGAGSGGAGLDDAVQISALSSWLSALDSQSASHSSRLIELTGEVSNGRYHVDPQILGDKMIQEHMRTAA